jgi:hypothetical protein
MTLQARVLMQEIPRVWIDLEPSPNCGRINMGAYSGTIEASKTYFGEPILETIVAGDISGDCQVNRADVEIMALRTLGPSLCLTVQNSPPIQLFI